MKIEVTDLQTENNDNQHKLIKIYDYYEDGLFLNPLYDRKFPHIKADKEKAEAIKEAFLHGWNAYKNQCWGHDEYNAKYNSCDDTLHAGLTIVDSLSTLYLMNLTEEYALAREFVEKDFKPQGTWSLFEFIIRFVGGFVSMYQLTQDDLYLNLAVESADAIYPVMKQGIFGGNIRLSRSSGKLVAQKGNGGWQSLADTSTFQLEFTTLSMLTGDMKYVKLAMKTYKLIWAWDPSAGLINMDYRSGKDAHVGGGADSYYEYIIKLYVMTRGVSNAFLVKYLQIVRDIKKKLIIKTTKGNYTGLGIFDNNEDKKPIQEHLATFAAGMIAVGTVKKNKKAAEDFRLADELATGYVAEYASTPTGVAAERVVFLDDKDKDFESENPTYQLRPETVESIYVMWKFTGLPKWRKNAWDIFVAINKSARASKGFGWIEDVEDEDPVIRGKQESYFFAETLKYLYLTFEDSSVISPAQWVFNTEGHPLRIFTEREAHIMRRNLQIYLVPYIYLFQIIGFIVLLCFVWCCWCCIKCIRRDLECD